MENEKFLGFFGGLYQRNENFLIISAGIFLISLFLGYLLSGMLDSVLGGVLEGIRKSVSEGQLTLDTISIFVNNFKIGLFIYLGGIPLGIFSALYLIVNGLFIGYVGAKFPLGNFLIFTIPHGVIEVIGIIISGAAGFRLGHAIFNILKGSLKINTDLSIKNQLKYLFESNTDEFKDSLRLFIIAVILILIAAFIEATFTIPWGTYISSL